MIELIAAISAVGATALISFIVYSYKPTITYKTSVVTAKFKFESLKIVASDDWDAHQIEICAIELKNVGLKDADGFEIWTDRFHNNVSYEVRSTTSIAKNAVVVESNGNSLRIAMATFPKGEKMEIDIVRSGAGSSFNWMTFNRTSGKFNLKNSIDIFGIRKFLMVIILPILIGLSVLSLIEIFWKSNG